MEEFGDSGRTVLFVSHNMSAVRLLCTHAIVLDRGRTKLWTDDVAHAIRTYMGTSEDPSLTSWKNTGGDFENQWFTPKSFSITDAAGECVAGSIDRNEVAWVQIEGYITNTDPALTIGYAIYSSDGLPLYWSYPTDNNPETWPQLKPGPVIFRSRLPNHLLNQGRDRLDMLGGLHNRKWLFEPGRTVPSLELSLSGGIGESPYFVNRRPTVLSPILDWETNQ